jgi:hypothetical protein
MIKKKNHWFGFAPPMPPPEPTPPLEQLEVEDLVHLFTFDGPFFDLADLEPLPGGVSFSDLRISNDGDDRVQIHIIKMKKVKNHNYACQYREYLHLMEVWKSKMEAHKRDVEQWKLWKIQEDEKIKKQELSNAAKILKKYGIPFPDIEP